jgi:hypothetical protein
MGNKVKEAILKIWDRNFQLSWVIDSDTQTLLAVEGIKDQTIAQALQEHLFCGTLKMMQIAASIEGEMKEVVALQ